MVSDLQAMVALGSSTEKKARMALLLCLFFLPLSLVFARIFLVLSGLLWSLGLYQSRSLIIRRSWLDLPLAGFAFLAGMSVVFSQYPAEGAYNFVHLMGLYLGVYFLSVQLITDRDGIAGALLVVFVATVLVCLVGLVQYFVGVDVTAQRWIDSDQFPELKTRIFSTLGNPNVLASFLVLSMGLLLGGIVGNRFRPIKIALLLVLLLSVGCILLTYSRGAWLAMAVTGILFLLIGRRLHFREAMVGAAGLILLTALSYQSLLPRLRSLLALFNPADSSTALRWALWESTMAMIREAPWLGLGWGSYRFVYPEYDFFVQNPDVIIYHAHNSLLSIASETGIPAMLIFASCWLAVIVRSLRDYFQTVDSVGKGISLGFFLSLSGMLAFSLTDHVLFNIQVTAVYWALLAFGANWSDKFYAATQHYWIFLKK